MTDPSEPVTRLLAAIATRGAVALRLEAPGLDRLLRSIVDAAVLLFDAEAASIALAETGGSLRFRVAAGSQGQGVVGMTVPAGQGIAGFVQATGQPIAVSDVRSDERFDVEAAARTGYVPRSLLAVPLEADDRILGVLEVLDRRGADGFDLRDISLAGAFARQAAVAIEVTRVERDVARLLELGLLRVAEGPADAAAAEDVARAVAAELAEVEAPVFWSLVDRIAVLRGGEPDRLALIADILDVAARHASRGSLPAAPSGRRSWRDRAGLSAD